MSHVMAGKNDIFLYIAENGYSAFLDEHQAEINPEYVYQIIKKDPLSYNINSDILIGIKKRNENNRAIQENSYNQYVSDGKPFWIYQSDVQKATITGQALSHVIFSLVDESNEEGIKRFNRALKNDALQAAGFGKSLSLVPTQEELANYVTAAHSLAFGKDLREDFKEKLNFPIDDNLYNNYYNILSNYIN
jgi:hypothetical protein